MRFNKIIVKWKIILNSEKKIIIRISAIEETVRIRPIRISNVEKIGIY